MYPGEAPINLLIEAFSVNSVMSTLITLLWPPNTKSARVLAVKVLPTPVVPNNKKLAIGLFLSLTPDLDLNIDDAIFLIACCCPMTSLFRFFSKFKNIFVSSCFSSESGTFALFDTT